jgi:hypothetical protein
MTASFVLHKVSRFLPVPEVTHIGKEKTLETIVKFKLNTTGPIIDITGGTNGTDNAQATSIARYETICKGLIRFCHIIGDYESSIILTRESCPANPFPIKASTLVEFLMFRCQTTTEFVSQSNTTLRRKDIWKNDIKCLGDWTSVSGIEMLQSAVTKLHKYYPSARGENVEVCKDCAILLDDVAH